MPLIAIALLSILLIMPWAISALVRRYVTGFSAVVLTVGISVVLMTGLILALWWVDNWQLAQQIAPLDRDGDGFWSTAEQATWTAQDHKNMAAYIGDGGRNVFAFAIAPAFALMYSGMVAAIAGKRRRY